MSGSEYQVGFGANFNGLPVWIGYRPCEPNSEEGAIIVQVGRGPHLEKKTLPPKEMLEFEYKTAGWREENGKRRFNGLNIEKQWFETKCTQVSCEWFVPMVKRMAAGEHVTLEEIQVGYFAHNGKPMPCGKWSDHFR